MSFTDEPVELFLERMRRLALEEEASDYSRHYRSANRIDAPVGPLDAHGDIQPAGLAEQFDQQYADESIGAGALIRCVPDNFPESIVTKRIRLAPPTPENLPELNSIFESERLLWWQVHELDTVARRERVYNEKTMSGPGLESKQAILKEKFDMRMVQARQDSGLSVINAQAIVDLFGFMTAGGHESPPWNFPFHPRLCIDLKYIMSYDDFASGRDPRLGIITSSQPDSAPVLHLSYATRQHPDACLEFEVRSINTLPEGRGIIGATLIKELLTTRRRTDSPNENWLLYIQLARPASGSA